MVAAMLSCHGKESRSVKALPVKGSQPVAPEPFVEQKCKLGDG